MSDVIPEMPKDIKHAWFSVVRRLQSVSKSAGLSVITISILVDSEGTPQAWTEPERILIEPKNAASAILSIFMNRR